MNITRRQFVVGGVTLATGAVITDGLWIEKFFIERNEYFIGDASANSYNIKLLQLSDLHLNSIQWRHRRLARSVNQANPDLLFLTGDSIDRADNLGLLGQFLQLLDYEVRKVAILGNWEYWADVDLGRLAEVYRKHNCDLLINQTRQYHIKEKLVSVTGIDDLIGGNADFKAAVNGYKPSDYHVVLTHCPEHRDAIETESNGGFDIDLVLSGHTHGGQITFLGIVPFKPRGSGRYLKGWYKEKYPFMYVSKGIGTAILPIRFGARPEIGIFNFKA